MTLDEAHVILNAKRGDNLEHILRVRLGVLLSGGFFFSDDIFFLHQNYEQLFKANAPPETLPKTTPRSMATPRHSHYLQSKVVRARERIEAEWKIAAEEPPPATSDSTSSPNFPHATT
jgi:import inner membrane translocase subunit TIM16